ncbi:MAG: metallophosphoesterase [Oscillospiraceae bacterium]|nr:metallophosphoesterase [Oscillospiraceae bacterium]
MAKRSFRKAAVWAAALAGCAAFLWWQNNDITVSSFEYVSPRVDAAFDGYRIVQISDLHDKAFGAGQSRLLTAVQALEPDAVVITGDLIDSADGGTQNAQEFVAGALLLAPVYYVTGNHESRADSYADLRAWLTRAGVTVLDGEKAVLARGDAGIELLGVGDPEFDKQHASGAEALAAMRRKLAAMCADGGGLRILLSHRPELLSLYAEYGVDIVFCGHAHGGQWRLPFVGGLYAPDQGFFPAYTAGAYTLGGTTEYVSRGLGSSVFPLRLFNRPELVCVTLRAGE